MSLSLTPGVAALETIAKQHSFPIRPYDPAMGWMKGNPFHEVAITVARTVGIDFIVNVVKNCKGEVVHAVAGGLELALWCDLRVAAENAVLLTSFARVGFSGDYGGTYFATQVVGAARAIGAKVLLDGAQRAPHGPLDLPALGIFFGCTAAGYAFAGFSNFFLRRPFASDAVFALVAMVTIAAKAVP